MSYSTNNINSPAFSGLAQDKSLWHMPALAEASDLPAPIVKEYKILRKLIEVGSVYQAAVKLKDFAEAAIRLVVLTSVEYLVNSAMNNGASAESAYSSFSDFLIKPPSAGAWENKLYELKKKSTTFPPFLGKMLSAFTGLCKALNISPYRNEYIGHGAYMTSASPSFIKDTSDRLKKAAGQLALMNELWKDFSVEICGIPQKGRKVESSQEYESGEITLSCGNEKISAENLIIFDKDRYYFFDKFNRDTQETEYLCFSDGSRLSKSQPLFADLYKAYEGRNTRANNERLDKNVISDEIAITYDEISNLALYFTEDETITDWLQACLHHYTKGIFILRGASGCGKSAYCAAIDPLLSPYDYISLENTEVRCYYASRCAFHAQMGFANFTENIFNLKYQNGIRRQILSVSKQMTHAGKNCNASVIAAMLYEWRNNTEKKGKRHCEKLLYVIDGIDLMANCNPALLNMIPDEKTLDEGVYLLLTTRGYIPKNIVASESMDITASDVTRVAKTMIEKQCKAFVSYEDCQLPEYIVSNIAMSQTAVSVMLREGNVTATFSEEQLIRHYFSILFGMYGTSLTGKACSILKCLFNATVPLSLETLCNEIGEDQVNLSVIGILRDLQPVLMIDYSTEGIKYSISPIMNKILPFDFLEG